ncbi:MAG: export ABC transporter ATP-binding protein, partial [Psychrobacillus psychrodurans]
VSDNQTIELKADLFTANFEKALGEHFPKATLRIEEKILTISMSKSEEPLATIFAIAAANNVVITSAIVKVPSLEDVFLHLTGKALRD